jgi:hypothetical protein
MYSMTPVLVQASINQMRFTGKLVQQALSSMLDILKQEVHSSSCFSTTCLAVHAIL